ncbi:MAG: DUF167 domain-containing protein [archaeon]|nr:DUF167 domain-containing protein [archaeon]
MKIRVIVVPNSGRQEILKISEKEYKVFLKRSPEKNKANDELVGLLKKEFKCPVAIIRGKTSKTKLVEIKNGD